MLLLSVHSRGISMYSNSWRTPSPRHNNWAWFTAQTTPDKQILYGTASRIHAHSRLTFQASTHSRRTFQASTRSKASPIRRSLWNSRLTSSPIKSIIIRVRIIPWEYARPHSDFCLHNILTSGKRESELSKTFDEHTTQKSGVKTPWAVKTTACTGGGERKTPVITACPESR